MSSTSSPSRKRLDQGVSASRAGTAQKRPPGASSPQRRQKSARVSVARSASSRQSADESADSASTPIRKAPAARVASAPARKMAASAPTRSKTQTAVVEPNADWATAERVLLDRTLRLHSLSPLHLSSLPSHIREVGSPLFQMLRSELLQYINLRLSDGLGFLEGADAVVTNTAESGDLRPSARRRRTNMDKVGKVRIGFMDDLEFNDALRKSSSANAWAIEIELGKPITAEDAQTDEPTAAELCHIIFIPALQSSRANNHVGLSYPLIATKTPSVAVAGDLMSVSANIGPMVLLHALDWVQKRFDCRISSPTGASSIASQLKGAQLESLAELVVRRTRDEMGDVEGTRRTSTQRAIDEFVKPVELSFAFPASLPRPSGSVPGPAPELATLTLTVPWEICMTLLETLPIDQPLLPALNRYLCEHTSMPLDALELVKIGVAGVSVGSGRVKISHVPRQRDADAKPSALRGKVETVEPSDRRRAGAVFALLARLAQGMNQQTS